MNIDDKMLNRDKELKKALDLEKLHFQRANPCYSGKIDYSSENLKKSFTQKECDALHGKYNSTGGICIRNNINLSNTILNIHFSKYIYLSFDRTFSKVLLTALFQKCF
jgi:hypothetical protein